MLRSQWPQPYGGTDGFLLPESVSSRKKDSGYKRMHLAEKTPGNSCPFWSSKVLTSSHHLIKVERPWEPISSHNCHQLLALPQHKCSPLILSLPPQLSWSKSQTQSLYFRLCVWKFYVIKITDGNNRGSLWLCWAAMEDIYTVAPNIPQFLTPSTHWKVFPANTSTSSSVTQRVKHGCTSGIAINPTKRQRPSVQKVTRRDSELWRATR